MGGLQIEFLPLPYQFVVEKAVFDEFYLFIYYEHQRSAFVILALWRKSQLDGIYFVLF